MNILIVGNGFDLSHYLPTKYDHFMVAMAAIESWDESKGEMRFDDLFGKDYWYKNDKTGEEWQNEIFQNTKAIYKTEDIKISVDGIKKLKKQLKENVWYQYFSEHVKEVKTWIDFETKIEEGLKTVVEFIKVIEGKYQDFGEVCSNFYLIDNSNLNKDDKNYYLYKLNFEVLNLLKVCERNPNYGKENELGFPAKKIGSMNEEWFKVDGKASYGFSTEKYIGFLNQQLEDFIELFNFYLEDVVKKLKPKKSFKELKTQDYDLTEIDQIYSFNYTQTYLIFYKSKTEIDFLHGKSGEDQNMVLGISELEDDVLKKIKAYGFTKYHQKLMKGTNYGFLNHNEKFDNLVNPSGMRTGDVIQINIWGHSLDVSDEDYIQEIFSFNGNEDQYVRVTVFYFDTNAKFSLLANLLHILDKEKVEHWMKQGWLTFKPNPDIAQLNEIKPVDLP
ncbi:AbiH family protein [Acinetobacter sp. ANC 5584]